MRHTINDSYKDGFVKIAFCCVCGCDDNVQLLTCECPGEKATKLPDWWLQPIDRANQKA